jgi:hypothetical protein
VNKRKSKCSFSSSSNLKKKKHFSPHTEIILAGVKVCHVILEVWSGGIVSDCGDLGCEIESRLLKKVYFVYIWLKQRLLWLFIHMYICTYVCSYVCNAHSTYAIATFYVGGCVDDVLIKEAANKINASFRLSRRFSSWIGFSLSAYFHWIFCWPEHGQSLGTYLHFYS